MSIAEKIISEIADFLLSNPSDNDLRKFLSCVLCKQSPTQAFHRLDLQTVKQPIIVHVKLMAQDIRENYYTYPFVISRPFNSYSKIWNFKFFKSGNQDVQFNVDYIQNPNYFSYLADRESIFCTPIMYETEWMKQIEKNNLKDNVYEMITNELNMFKLGEVFSVICVYEPQTQLLHFIRKANEEEINKFQNMHQYLTKPISAVQIREKLLKKLSQIYSQRYSNFVLYTMLSTSHFFISAIESNVSLLKKLLPRVCQLKIKVPFKDSFFPYRKQVQNDQQVLIQTAMQMSNDFTFVIIDFSNFSKETSVKIENEQIDNIKALKVFVEEGKTIYRWLYGQSLLDHKHVGMIVKASNIISPQYFIPEKVEQEIKMLPEFSTEQLREFRCYIHQMRKLNPTLKGERQKIQQKIHCQTSGTKFNQLSLVKVMQLSKLSARSKGEDQIKFTDFQQSCQLFF